MFPNKSTLYIAAINDGDERNRRVESWKNVYDFDMVFIQRRAVKEPNIKIVEKEQIITDEYDFKTFDIEKSKIHMSHNL